MTINNRVSRSTGIGTRKFGTVACRRLCFFSILFFVATCFVTTSPAFGGLIVFDDGGVHTINTDITPDIISLGPSATTLNIDAGANIAGGAGLMEWGVRASGSSVVEILGGTIAAGDFSTGVLATGNSTVAVHGGVIQGGTGPGSYGIQVGGSAEISVHGGQFLGGSGSQATGLRFSTGGKGQIYGGIFNGGSGSQAAGIRLSSDPEVTINGGTFTGGNGTQSHALTANGDNQVTITGGTFIGGEGILSAAIHANSGGLIELFGGSISDGTGVNSNGLVVSSSPSEISIYGSDFNYGFGPIAPTSGTLMGILSDGSPLDVSFLRSGGGQINLISQPHFIPEPSTLLLAILGSLLLGRFTRRRR